MQLFADFLLKRVEIFWMFIPKQDGVVYSLLTVNEMIDFETACMVYKALHGLAPPYMKSMFQKLSESCNRTLRNTSTDLRIPFCKPQMGSEAFRIEGLLFGIN